LTRAIIVTDIDMTIVDDTYRRARAQGLLMNGWLLAHLVPSTLRWDRPVPSAVRSLNIFSNFFDIVYLTNRTENMRKETEDFLSRNGYPKGRLLMHSNGFFDPSWKVRAFRQLLESGASVAKVYDDEKTYVDSYRKLGANAYHVTGLDVWDRILEEVRPSA
jgi:phosphatidate phosphatase APP1